MSEEGGSAVTVAVLFARADSVYKKVPGCDVWDEARDARGWKGGAPVVAHPPCRGWGRLRTFANVRPGELDLARWAVVQVQRWGGVIEHPACSLLWQDQGLPGPGQTPDIAGGWTFAAPQKWWGHRAEKASWFYICGAGRRELPPIPIVLGMPEIDVPNLGKAAREHTPPALAAWLVDLARKTRPR